jgi:hypothetical protein
MTAPVRTVGVKFEAQGVPEVQAAVRQVSAATAAASASARASSRQGIEAAADGARDKWNLAGREISKTFADFGRNGQVAGRDLKQLVILGGEMAMTFGPAGPIASAVGLLTLGIVSMFKRARDEQTETQRQFMKGLSDMGAAADYAALNAQAAKLWRGTFDAKSRSFKGGVSALGAQERQLRGRGANPFDLAAPGALKDFYRQTVTSPLDGKEVTVQQLLEQYRSTIDLLQNPLESPRGPRAVIGITADLSADKKAAGAAASAAAQRAMLDYAGQRRANDTAAYQANPYIDPSITSVGAANLSAGYTVDDAKKQIAKGILPTQDDLSRQIAASMKGMKFPTPQEIAGLFHPVGQAIAMGITESLQEGLRQGIAQALSGDIGGAVKTATSTILRGLGDMFAQIAVKALMMSELMKSFTLWLTTNPWAAAAVALAMMAAATAMGGSAHGGRGGGGYGASSGAAAAVANGSAESTTRLLWGGDSSTMAAGLNPRSATNITVIGPNDPTAQRAIQELLNKAGRRG